MSAAMMMACGVLSVSGIATPIPMLTVTTAETGDAACGIAAAASSWVNRRATVSAWRSPL